MLAHVRRPLQTKRKLQIELLEDRTVPTSGILDPTFSSDGLAFTDLFGGADSATTVALQPDGKIVVGGYAGAGMQWAIARYESDGDPDLGFGTNGVVITDFGGTAAVLDVALLPNGKIIAVGQRGSGGTANDFAIARYNPDGSLDTSFDTDGKVITDFGSADEGAQAVVLQPDGKAVVVGIALSGGGGQNFAVARYDTNGTLDPTFDSDGKVLTDFLGFNDSAFDVVLQGDGKIVVAGIGLNAVVSGQDFGIVRYLANGAIDTTFGTNGKVMTDMGGSNSAHALALRPDGRLVVGGWHSIGFSSDWEWALAQYLPDGSLDTSFGTAGLVTTNFAGSFDVIEAMALQPDGKIVASGYVNFGSLDMGLARFNLDGTLDGTFGSSGKTVIDIAGGEDYPRDLAIQSNGQIVVVGHGFEAGSIDFVVARFDGGSNTAPQLSGITTGMIYQAKTGARFVQPSLTATDQIDPNLVGATVQVSNFIPAQDVLGFSLQGGITAQIDPDLGTITFSGTASLAEYQAVLRSVTYTNTSATPTGVPRAISIQVDDGRTTDNLSNMLSRNIVVQPASDIFEVDNTPEQAKVISTDGTPQNHTIHVANDVDWVTFTLAMASNVTIETDGVAGGDTRLGLYRENGKRVQMDDNSGNGNYSRIVRSGNVRSLPAGIYRLKIDEKGNNNTILEYSIRVTATPAVGELVGNVVRGGDSIEAFIRPYNSSRVIDPNLPTWLVIHGRTSNSESPHINRLAIALDRNSSKDQVLVLDWEGGAEASGALDFTGEDWIQPVASWAADRLRSIGFESLGRSLQLNLVGHSWGTYVAAELAEALAPQGVNSIIALDPPTDAPVGVPLVDGGVYNPDAVGQINFQFATRTSWAFVSTNDDVPSSRITGKTADETYIVLGSDHTPVVDLFSNLLERPTSTISKRFKLSRLLAPQSPYWLESNRYNFDGKLDNPDQLPDNDLSYEGVLYAADGGVKAKEFRFFDPLQQLEISLRN